MKSYLAWIKKTLAAGIGFIIVWLASFSGSVPSIIPSRYVPAFTLAVGLAGTYMVWKLNNGAKPVPDKVEAIPNP